MIVTLGITTSSKLILESSRSLLLQGITATGALAYDAITVLEAGFKNILQQMPNLFRSGRKRSKGLTCNLSGEQHATNIWEHGKEIATALKSVQIQGLTGAIRYLFTFLAESFDS